MAGMFQTRRRTVFRKAVLAGMAAAVLAPLVWAPWEWDVRAGNDPAAFRAVTWSHSIFSPPPRNPDLRWEVMAAWWAGTLLAGAVLLQWPFRPTREDWKEIDPGIRISTVKGPPQKPAPPGPN